MLGGEISAPEEESVVALQKIDLRQLPVDTGKLIPPMAAIALRVSRQRVIQMLEEGKFETAEQVPGSGTRPAAYQIRVAEIRELAVANCPACRIITSSTGAAPPSCGHFTVTERGEVILAELPGDPEPVEHAVPFAAAERSPRV